MGYFVNQILGIQSKELILFGHSLGSAPTVHLAITQAFRDIRAIILLSPIASGVRLVSPDIKMQDLEKIDVFCNIKKVIDVCCPIFLIHGHNDQVIPIQQSLEMAKFMKNPYEWHPRNGDHCNILTKYRAKFLQKCKFFFEFLTYSKNKHLSSSTTTSYNCATHDKHITNVMLQENYITCNQRDSLREIHTSNNNYYNINENGQAFSAKDIHRRCSSLLLFEEKDRKNMRVENPHNSQLRDYPFDIISNDKESYTNRSDDETDFRVSNLMCYNDNKEMESQFNKVLIKHNGI